MHWRIVFYMDAEGCEPVKDFILEQADSAIAEILHVFKLLSEFDIGLGMPYVAKVGRSGIRELRVKHGSNIYRIFFFAHTGRRLVLLHAIKKKTDKISENDIRLAVSRMNDHRTRI